jgi:hypothetical protein
MPLITSKIPASWQELKDLVTAILTECGMQAPPTGAFGFPAGAGVSPNLNI